MLDVSAIVWNLSAWFFYNSYSSVYSNSLMASWVLKNSLGHIAISDNTSAAASMAANFCAQNWTHHKAYPLWVEILALFVWPPCRSVKPPSTRFHPISFLAFILKYICCFCSLPLLTRGLTPTILKCRICKTHLTISIVDSLLLPLSTTLSLRQAPIMIINRK